jgi:hypothetical protein
MESLMIRTEGTLLVKKIKQSRNGPFCVADLLTDFGEFKVKDSLLDQFAEGEYRGVLWISEIYLAQYVSFGRGVTELRARLHDLQVDTESRLSQKSSGESEPDPIDERPPVRADSKATDNAKAKPAKLSVSRKDAGTATPDPTTQNEDAAERELFGDEICQFVVDRQPIKLDPTIDDRARFRAQTQKLRQIGYQFDAKTQSWSYQT